MKKIALFLLCMGLAGAAPVSFRVATELKHVNVVTLESETDFVNLAAVTNTLEGNFVLDTVARTLSGKLWLSGKDLMSGSLERDQRMSAPDWFDFGKNPQISYEITQATAAGGNDYQVRGNFKIRNVTRAINATLMIKTAATNATTQQSGFKGDKVASFILKFKLRLSDFGIKIPEVENGEVAKEMDVTFKGVASNGEVGGYDTGY